MIKYYQYILSTLFIVFLQLSCHPLVAQQNKQMFMFQVDGNKYEKRSFDKNGKMVSKQIVEAGSVYQKGTKNILPVKILSYDRKGKLKDTYQTNYTCNPLESSLFMYIFQLSDNQSYTDVSVQLLSKNDFYLQGIKVNDALPNISFSMDIEGGVLGFFGANSKIKISGRKILAEESTLQNFRIHEKIQIKAYMFGFNISTINYTVSEIFNTTKGIVKQEYKEDSG